MNLDLKGFKRQNWPMPVSDVIIHKGRHLSESDTRKLVNYAIEQGYETLADVPDEIADKVCDAYNKDFDKYDDTPALYSLEYIKATLRKVQNCYNVEWDADDIMDKLEAEL